MPELPEMQALAERLEAAVGGHTLERIDALQFSALKTVSPTPDELHGRTLTDIARRGKYIDFDLDGPRILLHLSQGGRVTIEQPPKTTKPKGSVVRLRFEGDTSLLVKEFGTERKASWWVLAPDDDGPLTTLGHEPDSDAFAELIRTGDDSRRLHTMLRHQKTVAGLGRGYTDDALHRAKLSPFASLGKLSDQERERLLDAIATTLADGLAAERKRTGGLPNKLGDHWRVHNAYGTPCPDCGNDLRRVSYGSHEVTYCPACQTQGKILADRRMSRLIR